MRTHEDAPRHEHGYCRPCWRDKKVSVPAVAVLSITGNRNIAVGNNVPVCAQHITLSRAGAVYNRPARAAPEADA